MATSGRKGLNELFKLRNRNKIVAFFFLATTSLLRSIYSNALTNLSSSFIRLGQSTNNYYYQSIQILVDRSDIYSITIDSSASLYAYLYNNSFDSNNPSTNLITSDFNQFNNRNFTFSTNLNTGVVYILVITTINPNITGSFRVIVSGRGNSILIPSTTTTTTSGFIILINYSI